MSDLSRRDFFVQSGLYGGSLWMLLNARPRAVLAAQSSTRREALTEAQWKTVQAVTARIIPTDHEPGAIEANCVNFIDKALAHEDADLTPHYAAGLPAVDAAARARFGRTFAELATSEQDVLLVALQDGKVDGWNAVGVTAADFFETVRVHTIIGFLSDPVHGGNRDFAGWKVVGYPGPAHHRGGYTPAQMIGQEKIVPIWDDEA